MVVRLTCIMDDICPTVTERDSYKRRTSLACFSSRLDGRPPVLPLALAASSPARVRSRIRSRSNWANDPKILNMSVPPGVLVSIDSVSERNCTPLASKSLMSSTRFCRDRPSLSSFQTTTVSPSRSRSSMWSSSGRCAFAPDATSVKIRSQPTFSSASRCRSVVWSPVLTRAYPYVMLAMRAMVPLPVSRLTLCDIDFETGFGTLLTVKSKNLKHCIALFQKRTFSGRGHLHTTLKRMFYRESNFLLSVRPRNAKGRCPKTPAQTLCQGMGMRPPHRSWPCLQCPDRCFHTSRYHCSCRESLF